MPVQNNPSLCAGCGICEEVCPVGAIRLVDYQAVINHQLCTECHACVDACPNRAITAVELPVPVMPAIQLPLPSMGITPAPAPIKIPQVKAAPRGFVPVAGTVLAFLGKEVAPRVVDIIVNALERKLAQPAATTSTPTAVPPRMAARNGRGLRNQIRFRGGRR